MDSVFQYDVIIAGAGPAGCAAALILKHAGFKILLVDNVSNEQFQIGESMPGATIRLLRRLGISSIENLLDKKDFKNCAANASSWGSDEWVYQDALINPEGGGWHVNRSAFNAALRKKVIEAEINYYAGRVELVTKKTDSGMLDSAYVIQLKSSHQVPALATSKWLIDATGRKSLLCRRLNIKRKKVDNQIAIVYWVKADAGDVDRATRIKSVAEGWWYTALLPGNSRVISFYSLPKHVREIAKSPLTFFKKFNSACILPFHVNSNTTVEFKTYDAGTVQSEKVTIENVVCVGDAAVAFDPLSSQGIYFALFSGIKGAEAIIKSDDALGKKNIAMNEYELQVDKVFQQIQSERRYFYNSEYRFASEPFWKTCRFDYKASLRIKPL